MDTQLGGSSWSKVSIVILKCWFFLVGTHLVSSVLPILKTILKGWLKFHQGYAISVLCKNNPVTILISCFRH